MKPFTSKDSFVKTSSEKKHLFSSFLHSLFILLLLFSFSTLFACSSSSSKSTKEYWQDEKYFTVVWLDADTCQVTVIGLPSRKEKDIEKRKIFAKKGAYVNAHYRILNKFKTDRIQGVGDMRVITKEEDRRRFKELVDIIKGGKTIKIYWNSEQHCILTYRVQAKDLKRKTKYWFGEWPRLY